MALYPEPPFCESCGDAIVSYRGAVCDECREGRSEAAIDAAEWERDCGGEVYDGPWDVNGQDVRAV